MIRGIIGERAARLAERDAIHVEDQAEIETLEAEVDRLTADAEALARAVSASLPHGEQSPLADALTMYLERHPWSDL